MLSILLGLGLILLFGLATIIGMLFLMDSIVVKTENVKRD